MSFPNSKTTPRRKEKARTWRRLHKWVGLVLTFFILAFALSGVFLNHRTAITRWDLPRRWLPQQYVYENWNNGYNPQNDLSEISKRFVRRLG